METYSLPGTLKASAKSKPKGVRSRKLAYTPWLMALVVVAVIVYGFTQIDTLAAFVEKLMQEVSKLELLLQHPERYLQ